MQERVFYNVVMVFSQVYLCWIFPYWNRTSLGIITGQLQVRPMLYTLYIGLNYLSRTWSFWVSQYLSRTGVSEPNWSIWAELEYLSRSCSWPVMSTPAWSRDHTVLYCTIVLYWAAGPCMSGVPLWRALRTDEELSNLFSSLQSEHSHRSHVS